MKNPSRRQGGFTLIELMVAVTITGIVSVALAQMLQVGQKSSDRTRIMVDMQQNARVGLESMIDDIRHVSYGKDPTEPSISYAGPDSLVFVADIMPSHVGAERISFFLSPDGDPDTDNPDDTVLMRVVADTAGVPLVSAPQAYGIARGGLNFRWFNGSGTELPNPVPQPEQVGEAFVSLTAAASRQIGGVYPTITLSSTIYPRNLPLSPARSRPSVPTCFPLVYPNCVSATMSWSTPTTNTDGTPLLLSDISHFNLYCGTDPQDESLYMKVARTVNQWTIGDLEGGQTYYLSVTCVSRSGVESFKCTCQADMISNQTPEAVAGLSVNTDPAGGLRLTWTPVSQFLDGNPITTPISYLVYRSDTPGFTPSELNLVATLPALTEYLDSGMAECSMSYYRVTAKACGNEGDPSPEGSGSHPAIASCPSGVTAQQTVQLGTIQVSWTAPTTRTDGSALSPGDISAYRVYADTVHAPTQFTTVPGAQTSTLLAGLIPCKLYYLNVRCVDGCGHPGDLCPGNEVSAFTSSSCDPAAPMAPAGLQIVAYDEHVSLQWPANHTDCDLLGYRVYYGSNVGGPYNGAFAQQGPSPITLPSGSVTMGDICRYDLTGLEPCQSCFAVVRAIDLCDPPHESESSPEASGTTSCTPCLTTAGCASWAVVGVENERLHLEVYTTQAGGETIIKLTPNYSGDALVREVWLGRPLAKVWAADGSAGQDGNIGPQPAGSILNINDTTIPSWTAPQDGLPMLVVFDRDVRDLAISFALRGYSGICTANGTGRGAAVMDDFDDGDFNGWTPVEGTWTVTGGEVYQSATNNNFVLRSSGPASADQTVEAKIKLLSGGSTHSAYLVVRYQNSTNYYVCGIRGDTDKVQFGKIQSGVLTIPAGGAVNMVIDDDTWYDVRAVVTTDHVQVYVNCQRVIDIDTPLAWATGGTGLCTAKTKAHFDDARVFAGAVLP